MRTHSHTLVPYTWAQAVEKPMRRSAHLHTEFTPRQEFLHKGPTPTAPPPRGGGVTFWPSCPALGTWGTHLGDLGIGALHVVAGQVKPGAGGAATVLLEGAPALVAAPATLKLAVGLQAEAAALPLGRALVEMNCRESGAVTDGAGRPSLPLPSSRGRDRDPPTRGSHRGSLLSSHG